MPVLADDATALRIVVPALPVEFDPHRAASPLDTAVAEALFQGLTDYDASGALVPGAAAWSVDAAGLAYAFTLRDGLKWSDGQPVEAGDFAAGLARAKDPSTAAAFAHDLDMIATIEAVDRRVLNITLKRASASFLEMLATPIAAPIPRHRLAVAGDAWAQPGAMVTNGAFMPAPGPVLVKNPHAPMPVGPERVTFHVADTADAAAARVKDGAADLLAGFSEGPGAVADHIDVGENLSFVAVNTTRKMLNVREVRHALAMTIDREGLVRALGLTDVTPAYTMAPPAVHGGVPPSRAPYAPLPLDTRAAIAEVLLMERGIDAANPASCELIYPDGVLPARISKLLAEGWAKQGMWVQPVGKTQADYAQALRHGDYDLALATWPGPHPDPVAYLAPLRHMPDPRNVARYTDADFQSRMAEADAEIDPARRLMLLSEAEAVLIQDQPILPLFFFRPAKPVSNRVKGWSANVRGIHPWHGFAY
jgi:oligopeptide transport system substrate-binding protein